MHYWSILKLPSWFRSRRNGLWPLGYVYAQSQKDAGVSDSVLVNFMPQVLDDATPDAKPDGQPLADGCQQYAGEVCNDAKVE